MQARSAGNPRGSQPARRSRSTSAPQARSSHNATMVKEGESLRGRDGFARVLRAIRRAQDQGLRNPSAGKARNMGPPYAIACEEIRKGHKSSHWIWYVWPSLSSVRSSMHPEFLLPDFKTACAYLCDCVLAERLLEISNLATKHLEDGVDPAILFGRMHHCDFPKFYEAMTLFALAAHMNGNAAQEGNFLAGIRACGADCLEQNTVNAVISEGIPGIDLAEKHLSAALAAVDSEQPIIFACK
mmetsp:Transcript_157908/g.294566  ORF Transcript_157908/g.294566 Transcript_157908/m.294566 type:complete len:242 (+) Transcript_157908:69-794(+)